MYVAYGGKDQFNLDAQIESFLYVAHQRGPVPPCGVRPEGKAQQEDGAGVRPERHRMVGPFAGAV